MSETIYLKCLCSRCSGSIEFPAQGVGLTVNCPHCAQRTVLSGSPSSSAASDVQAASPVSAIQDQTRPRRRHRIVVGLLAVLGLAVAAGLYLKTRFPARLNSDRARPDVAEAGVVPDSSATNAPGPVLPPPPTIPKSKDDLVVGPIGLEKAKSGSLVYAVGVLNNQSDHQRYGVKIEIELSDAQGRPAGKATDYVQFLEPRKQWRFRALILDAKAVSARLSNVTEDD